MRSARSLQPSMAHRARRATWQPRALARAQNPLIARTMPLPAGWAIVRPPRGSPEAGASWDLAGSPRLARLPMSPRARRAQSPPRRAVRRALWNQLYRRAVREPGEQFSQKCSGGWGFRGTAGFPGGAGRPSGGPGTPAVVASSLCTHVSRHTHGRVYHIYQIETVEMGRVTAHGGPRQ